MSSAVTGEQRGGTKLAWWQWMIAIGGAIVMSPIAGLALSLLVAFTLPIVPFLLPLLGGEVPVLARELRRKSGPHASAPPRAGSMPTPAPSLPRHPHPA